MVTSRWPGFYKLSLASRRAMVAEALGIGTDELEEVLALGGLDAERADKTIENVVGTYALPLGLVLNVRMNGRDHVAPMAVEEPSVVAAASSAAKMARDGGGFFASADPPIMIAQVQLDRVRDVAAARAALAAHHDELVALADAAVPNLLGRGGGVRGIEARDLGDGWLVVHVLVDCRDAMGANLVNTLAEAIAPRLSALTGGRIGLRILSNLAEHRKVRVRCRVPAASLRAEGFPGEEVAHGIARASEFAERDPFRAATHNKGVMNGIDPVVIATGNDWRAVEAGAHAWAARAGRYAPLSRWHVEGEGGETTLCGELELPLALGIVGGTLRIHDAAALALELSGATSASELAMLAASVGLASNLAALRALATVGIQEGHMALHARSVAIAAGARGDLVEEIARRIHASGHVTLERAREVLLELAQIGPVSDAAE